MGKLTTQTVELGLEFSPPKTLSTGSEGGEDKCIDWDLVKPKNEKLYNFTNCNGALPNEGFGAREPD